MHEVHSYNFQAMVSGNFGPVNPFLVIHIRRDHLVDDTLNEVMRQSPQDLKKPLKVRVLSNYCCYSLLLKIQFKESYTNWMANKYRGNADLNSYQTSLESFDHL